MYKIFQLCNYILYASLLFGCGQKGDLIAPKDAFANPTTISMPQELEILEILETKDD